MSFKDFYIKRKLGVFSFLYSLLVALFWTAERINWAGISKFLGADTNPSFIVMNLPVIICVLLWVLCGLSLFGLCRFERSRLWSKITLITSIVFTVAILVVIYFGSYDYLPFIWQHFTESLVYAALILFIALLLFFPIIAKSPKATVVKSLLLAAVTVICLVTGYQLKCNKFSYGPVVYAVGDEYQIVFSTSDNAVAWVEIGSEKYYDLYAGSMKSADHVHKVYVPQKDLDKAGKYTICSRQMIYRGPFGGYLGKTISESKNFRPVNTADGISYYALADIHENFKGAIAAAKSKPDMDFLVIIGDTVSMVEDEGDAQGVNYVAGAVTGGEIPVVYARGNHEIKGEYAEDLYKYVGSKDQAFYYTFSLSGIKGIVLDLGEDHDDDWWEYYETAQFDLYRNQQTQFLKDLRDGDYFSDSIYNMVICHIPIQFVNYRHNHESYKNEWTEILNDMDIDVALYGHQHDITAFEPGAAAPNRKLTYNRYFKGAEGKTYNGYLTDFNFYGFMVARAGMVQTGGDKMFTTKEFTGLLMDVKPSAGGFAAKDYRAGITQTAVFMNSDHQAVSVCNMFGTDEPKPFVKFTR